VRERARAARSLFSVLFCVVVVVEIPVVEDLL
jgi:hypothetical protein